jgi:hypothetical protein
MIGRIIICDFLNVAFSSASEFSHSLLDFCTICEAQGRGGKFRRDLRAAMLVGGQNDRELYQLSANHFRALLGISAC